MGKKACTLCQSDRVPTWEITKNIKYKFLKEPRIKADEHVNDDY